MKLTFFTLLILSVIIGFESCRKSGSEIDIKQYDEQQIQNYIAANGIAGMLKDADTTIAAANKDTTGIYYKIISQGTGKKVDFPDSVSYVYTIKSFDGKYEVTDTVLDHFQGFLGHVVPNGLALAIRNDLKNRGGKMRALIPSHLAYGVNGVGSGSSTVANNKIAGNQCLDFTINLIDDQNKYDDIVINNYIKANGLTGYTRRPSGLWYKITKVGAGNIINLNSNVSTNYKLYLMDNTIPNNDTTFSSSQLLNFGDLQGSATGGGAVPGVLEGIQLVKGQGAISMLVPSRLAYGPGGNTGVPANSCLRWDFYNISVVNY